MRYDPKESGQRIRDLRKLAGLTQEQLAETVNISTSALGKIERGLQGISLDLLIELSDFFSVSLDYIVINRQTSKDFILEKIKKLRTVLNEMEKEL